MIYGKMWTVVKPTVGVPIMLAAVAIGSFSVHLAILTHTTWVSGFLEGGAKTAAVATAPAAPVKK
ncbi:MULTISPECIES: light-harvesting protein [Polynucleobacter]|jgi:light-harvesting protein B-800-850 alpha chain|uniref:Light-harvesting protein n=1 Tax=Polynucleobacter hirudinilacicola TaxID=1743166 RepID=A0A210RWQ5_9BURK|nr:MULTISPECIES: light-harvesting protein [Polynucleobacter]MBU3550127.1 light-harvesting protein [Polynucleobacter sp. MWH-Berg-3C6]MBU3578385.1 light-harvesting protein [Polynucleobacter sp. 73C-SIWE]OWF65370.1 light-harvesting protein [Polynucleobacter hirudinilacicola]